MPWRPTPRRCVLIESVDQYDQTGIRGRRSGRQYPRQHGRQPSCGVNAVVGLGLSCAWVMLLELRDQRAD